MAVMKIMEPQPIPCQIPRNVLISQKTGMFGLASQFCLSKPSQERAMVNAPVLERNSLAREQTTVADTK